MTQLEFEDYILKLKYIWLDYPFGEKIAVYKYGKKPEGKIVAIVSEGSQPLRVSLKCDPQLAEHLREKYESVLPGYHLNKRHWNTILCTGQLSKEEIFDLTSLSYQLVSS
ncbi:MmcQ/YjbR family DNA-binding protein [Candidatus Saccharibacteria bacterium]|jgi:predicted DNA-binding protein (MmcQ/YjbR family)|nr:MmcQ/YjbR family DNA-binding protein [Candidatus Saccharibacteria bacterium]